MTANSSSIVKSLILGLRSPMGYEKRRHSFVLLSDDQKRLVYRQMHEGSRTFAMLCNILAAQLYAAQIMGVPKQEMERYKPNYPAVTERLEGERFLCGDVLSQTYNEVMTQFTGASGKALLFRGERQLATFRTNGSHPITIRSTGLELRQTENGAVLCVHLFSKEWANANGIPTWLAFPVCIKPRDRRTHFQLEQLLYGNGQLRNAKLLRLPAGKRLLWVAHVVVAQERESASSIQHDVVLGIAFGEHCPVAVHIRKNGTPNDWAMLVGTGLAALNPRIKIQNEISKTARLLSRKGNLLDGVERRGLRERLQQLRKREQRIMKTWSQRIAASIAETAKRHGAGVWQLEKPDKHGRQPQSWLLRHWRPGMVVDAIRWQAQQCGAELILLPPTTAAYRCSECGHVALENRRPRKTGLTREAFCCVACGHAEYADNNSARNLSLPNAKELTIPGKPPRILV